MGKYTEQEIKNILTYSKEENKKFLYKILSLKSVSAFDVSYIMSNLKLTDKKIRLIEYSISQYSNLDCINSSESINEYIFEIVRNIEKLEKTDNAIKEELMSYRDEIESFKKILNYLVENISIFISKRDYPKQNFVFSTIYVDK